MKVQKKINLNASGPAQRAWAIMTPKQRAKLKKTYKQDPDKDGVPTGFDCRPHNPKKQEAFLPADQKYAYSHTSVPIKSTVKTLGEGTNGIILPVKDNKRFVVKIDKSGAWNSTKSEMAFYKKHSMSRLPLIIPQKSVKVGNQRAVLKPVVKPVVEPGNYVKSEKIFTRSRLEQLRQDIITLSYKGFIFADGLQLGIDKSNRLLQFDTGAMKHVTPITGSGINNKPFVENNKEWRGLLRALGKSVSEFGQIERVPILDTVYKARNRVISNKTKPPKPTISRYPSVPHSKIPSSKTLKKSTSTSSKHNKNTRNKSKSSKKRSC